MSYQHTNEFHDLALAKYGLAAQLRKCAEEHLEMAHAILRLLEYGEFQSAEVAHGAIMAVVEEFTDTEITRHTLNRVKIINVASVQAVINAKEKRWAQRMTAPPDRNVIGVQAVIEQWAQRARKL